MSRRARQLVIGGVALAVALTAVVGAYAYDHARRDRIAKGITVGGVDVGGLRAGAARAKLRRDLLAPLDRAIVVRVDGHRFRLSARAARVGADVDGMVAAALERTRRGSIFSRLPRELTGGRIRTDLPSEILYSHAAVDRLVRRVRRAVNRPARDAKVDFAAAGATVETARDGVQVDARRLTRAIERRLVTPGARTVHLRPRITRPKVTTAQLAKRNPAIIVVNRAAFRLTLYKDLKPTRTYRIAVGRAGLETPGGLYHVQDKQTNPAWHVPKSDWAGKLAGKVIAPDDPANPIKARWMGIYNGAGIHGTDALSSLGTAASHGCIRMAIPDVIQLFDQVPVGAPVFIA